VLSLVDAQTKARYKTPPGESQTASPQHSELASQLCHMCWMASQVYDQSNTRML